MIADRNMGVDLEFKQKNRDLAYSGQTLCAFLF
jgi:hypothetical protein